MADRIPVWGDPSTNPGKLREYKTGDDMVLPSGLKLQGGSVPVDPSYTFGAGKIPLAGPGGTIDPGWLPRYYGEVLTAGTDGVTVSVPFETEFFMPKLTVIDSDPSAAGTISVERSAGAFTVYNSGDPARVAYEVSEMPFAPWMLFSGGADGILLDASLVSAMYEDDAGTVPADTVGDILGLVRDQSGNGNDLTQPVSASRPRRSRYPRSGVRNVLISTDSLSTQSATVTAQEYTLSFVGTGTVTLSGASTAGPLAGTGAEDRVSLTFTPTAGALTLTVSGDVEHAQLEIGSEATNYQRVNGPWDVYEEGQPHIHGIWWDGVDDSLSTTLPAGTYSVAIAGTKGSWIDEVEHAGGAFAIGVDSYTGGPAGILGVLGVTLYAVVVDGALSESAKTQLKSFFKQLGSPGTFVPGAELVTNGTFDAGIDGWSSENGAVLGWDSNLQALSVERVGGATSRASTTLASEVPAGVPVLLQMQHVGGSTIAFTVRADSPANQTTSFDGAISTVQRAAFTTVASLSRILPAPNGNASPQIYDNISVRKLELIP